MNDKLSKVLIIIPAFNEQDSIQCTLRDIKGLAESWDVLVVDDGSSDKTVQYVEDLGISVISLPFNIGIGGAVSMGFLYALKKGYDVVVRVDADGQHDALSIQSVLDPILTQGADVCIGSRFKGEDATYRSSFLRRIGIDFFAKLITFLIEESVTDPTSGFNAFNQKAIQLFAQHYPSDYPEPEAIVIAKRAGLRVIEVPVKMNSRIAGVSSIRYFKTLYYMIKVTLAIALNYLRPRKSVGSEQ